jgi:hypothetical protein
LSDTGLDQAALSDNEALSDIDTADFGHISFFFAVLKGRRSDLVLLIQGQTWTLHHPTGGSTYFQCNISMYAHVWGLKVHKSAKFQLRAFDTL